jgi:N-acetylmuramoyl-L-alanine amidase
MPNFGRSAGAAAIAALAILAAPRLEAQQNAEGVRYQALRAQELRVSTSPSAAPDDFRVVINRYWSFVRRYPTSGYADNALWQAANLAQDAFTRFGEDRDKYRAIQLLQWLRDQYPTSRYVAAASTGIDQLAAAQSRPSQEPSAAPPASSGSADATTIRAVHREVLPELVRVTIELDREVPFYQERLEGPPRLFFDLKGTKTVPALADATFRYDSDIVRHIRLGRHPNSTTRIVLDLEDVGRYSVFTLYNPYRIVIDTERARSTAGVVSPAPTDKPVDQETSGTELASFAPAVPVAPGKPLAPSANSSGKYSVARQLGLGVSRIVIDAGHGGHDPGASAFGVSEAELVLDVALRLEGLLKEEDVDVVLTRRTDTFVSLEERTEIANREAADLFLSIHANASANASARGVETYFLNFALNPQAEAVAARENAASGKTMNSLNGIIKAITLNTKLRESRDLAGSLQRSLVRGLRTSNRALKDLGVKQAPFMVLIGASMPSALAEISFVTNRQEARLLKTPHYRQKVAESLLAGILSYQKSLKKVQTEARK